MSGNGHFPPKGWTVDRGYIAEVRSVLGYYHRGCEVTGRCQRQDCRRTCNLDYERLLKNGLADVDADRVKTTMRCNRLDGCGLEFRERPTRSITLNQLAHMSNVAPQVRCRHCNKHIVITTTAALLRQLAAAGHGDGATSIGEVSERIHGRCPKCQTTAWEVRFLWHDPAGRPPVWRRELDQRVAEAQRKRDLDRGLVA